DRVGRGGGGRPGRAAEHGQAQRRRRDRRRARGKSRGRPWRGGGRAAAPPAGVRLRRGRPCAGAARGRDLARPDRRAPGRHAHRASPPRRGGRLGPAGRAHCLAHMNDAALRSASLAPAPLVPGPLAPARVALVGNPNSGKTALFNALTGSRQKVANYAGVTVERKEGQVVSASGRAISVLDLPGTYSLRARSPDEAVTRDAVLGRLAGEQTPDVLVCVADATNLRLVLRLILELKAVGRPMVLALNMYDIAQRQGLRIDLEGLQRELGCPIVATVATRKRGIDALVAKVEEIARAGEAVAGGNSWREPDA